MKLLVTFLLKIGFKGIAQKAVSFLDRRADRKLSFAGVEAKTKVAQMQAQVDQSAIRADHSKEQMQHPEFWRMTRLFVYPLAAFWTAVIMDCIPYVRDIFGDQDVYDLPNEQFKEWAGMMIAWLFFLGTGVGAIKAIRK